MINFTSIYYQNYMSTGNDGIRINLDKYDKTLLMGTNGAGKSTMYLALYWCLFGKTFDTSIKNDQQINSLNKKKMLVEVEFSIGANQYKVVRGLKPAIFEIWINGELKKQDANTKDYQKYLNSNILKMSSKTFQQIVILGSKQYTPFMRLKAAERRSVIEDLLDIQYFSIMSDIVKKRVTLIKDKYTKLVNNIKTLDTKIELNQMRVDELNQQNENVIAKNSQRILDLQSPLDIQLENIETNKENILSLDSSSLNDKLTTVRDKHSEITTIKSRININLENTDVKLKFFHSNSECPTCDQSIDESYKEPIISGYNEEVDKYSKGIIKADEVLGKHNDNIIFIKSELAKVTTYQNNINSANTQVTIINNEISSLEEQNKALKTNVDTSEDERLIADMKVDLAEFIEHRTEITKNLRYYGTIVEMLKDGGIKTKIVNQYVPIINMLIQKYLDILSFNVEFTLDDEFKETIKSRGRDNFSYGNFSDGQKIRIDLALLFTFREITRMKNSASTNLLIMDEIADGSMDSDGIDDLIKIIDDSSDKSNIFIISHNSKIIEEFDNSLSYILKNNFTEVKHSDDSS